MYDVVIIGAGISGAACARELSRYELSVLLLEAGSDVASGTTRANSGIVHSGYDPVPGTAKARFNVEGSRLYPQLSEELDFPFERNGSLVVAFSEEERPALEKLLERGQENGVEGVRIVEADELHELEPKLSGDAVAALLAPTGGITNPYLACLAFAENAVENGVTCQLDTQVVGIEQREGGESYLVRAVHTPLYGAMPDGGAEPVEECFETKIVIDAAGVHSDTIAKLAGDESFHITPRAGEYVLLDRSYGGTFTHTMFQVPTAAGKGVLVSPTTGGNLIVGPDAIRREDPEDTSTASEGLDAVVAAAKKTWPAYTWSGVITNFAGVRASCLEHPDFILGEPEGLSGFFVIGGFDSPGLTAAPAVAVEYAATIANRLGAGENPKFNPRRQGTPMFSRVHDEGRENLIGQDASWGHMICRCEQVTEAEIVAAIHAPVPARTIDAVKWRTRAGMGRCQSGFCLPPVAEIIARELGIDPAHVRKGARSSVIALGHRGCLTDLPVVAFPGEGDGNE